MKKNTTDFAFSVYLDVDVKCEVLAVSGSVSVNDLSDNQNKSNTSDDKSSDKDKIEVLKDNLVSCEKHVEQSIQSAAAQDQAISTTVDKEDVPELLSAEDLKRLAASQPKSDEPPVLLKAGETCRRDTVLKETIEKLKKRVETLESNLPNGRSSKSSAMDIDVSTSCQQQSSYIVETSPSECVKDTDECDDSATSYSLENIPVKLVVQEEMEQNDDEKNSMKSGSSTTSLSRTSSRSSTPAQVQEITTNQKKGLDVKETKKTGTYNK